MKNIMKKLDKAMFSLMSRVYGFGCEERGEVNLVSILLIIVVTVGLVIIFRDRLSDLVGSIFDKIGSSIDGMDNV